MRRVAALAGSALLAVLLPLAPPAARAAAPGAVAITAVGDTTGYAIPPGDPLVGVRDLLPASDLFLFNAEGVFAAAEPPGGCSGFPFQSVFVSPPDALPYLRAPAPAATVASLANNHLLDCGADGLRETAANLEREGIIAVGAGPTAEAACEPRFLAAKGQTVAVLSYLDITPDHFSAGVEEPGAATWRLCDAPRRIADARRRSDVVVVSLHLHNGLSSAEEPDRRSLSLVRKALDAGADVVFGSGPHVPQGIIRRNRGVAVLSLGNFLFHPDYATSEKAHRSILARFTRGPDASRLVLVPLRLGGDGRPVAPGRADALRTLDRIAALSLKLGTRVTVLRDRGVIKVVIRR